MKGNWQDLFLNNCHVFSSSENDLNGENALSIKEQDFLGNCLPGESSGIQQQGYSPADGTCIICYSLSVTAPPKGIKICSKKVCLASHSYTHYKVTLDRCSKIPCDTAYFGNNFSIGYKKEFKRAEIIWLVWDFFVGRWSSSMFSFSDSTPWALIKSLETNPANTGTTKAGERASYHMRLFSRLFMGLNSAKVHEVEPFILIVHIKIRIITCTLQIKKPNSRAARCLFLHTIQRMKTLKFICIKNQMLLLLPVVTNTVSELRLTDFCVSSLS